MAHLAFNKVCEVGDFEHPELRDVISEIYPDYDVRGGGLNRKFWEVAMSVRALRRFGAVHADAVILGVGAGTEATSFSLSNYVRLVVATDLYQGSGEWAKFAPLTMLTDPARHAPCPFRADRLVVQHMDGRDLQYPNNTFDGIYSSSSIEHFGSREAVREASAEMARVLKPGGVLTLSTEYKVAGPRGNGWAIGNTIIMSMADIQEMIVAASGLAPVDEIDTRLSDETMRQTRDMESILNGDMSQGNSNIMIAHKGYIFCSIHLTLRKGM